MGLKNKRGLTPIIASVLLIGIVLVLAVIVFLWLRTFAGESYVKFQENVNSICSKLDYTAGYSNGKLTLANNGGYPISDFSLKLNKAGESKTLKLSETSNGLFKGLPKSEAGEVDISSSISGYNELIVIPILFAKGQTSGKNVEYICDESIGKKIDLTVT